MALTVTTPTTAAAAISTETTAMLSARLPRRLAGARSAGGRAPDGEVLAVGSSPRGAGVVGAAANRSVRASGSAAGAAAAAPYPAAAAAAGITRVDVAVGSPTAEAGARPVRSSAATSRAVGRVSGSRRVMRERRSTHEAPSRAGISGSRTTRAMVDSAAVPGKVRRPVRHSRSTRPSAYTSVGAPTSSPSACSGLR